LFAALALTACNVFDPIDSPTTDNQLISVARACFNRGDVECAQANYEKLSTNAADIKNSEEAMVALQAVNAGMSSFIAAFGQNNITTGKAITSIANSIGSNASQANRVALLAAYQKADLVGEVHLKGLARFVTALGVAAEMLAEASATKGNLLATDIATNATGCAATDTGTCGVSATCDNATSRAFTLTGATVSGDGSLTGVTSTAINTSALSLEIFHAAITTINAALTQMGVTSSSANIAGFTSTLAGVPGATTAYERCYREELLALGVGQ